MTVALIHIPRDSGRCYCECGTPLNWSPYTLAYQAHGCGRSMTMFMRHCIARERRAVAKTPTAYRSDGETRTAERRYETWLETLKDYGP